MLAFYSRSASARRTRRSIRPAEHRSIFATSFHYFTLVSFGHTTGTSKSRECQEETSGKNDSSESQPLFLAKGHQVQHPSALSLPPSRQLALQFGHFVLSRKRVCSTSLHFAQYATISYPGTLFRAGLTHTDQMQLNSSFGLSQCLPSR